MPVKIPTNLLTANPKPCLKYSMEENEHSIIRAVLSGDKEAYGTLVVRHSNAIFRVAFRITGDKADAEDVVQEAFLLGYRKLQSFESRAKFSTWIYRIAINCALTLKNKRKPEDADATQHQVQVADTAANPERLLLSREIEALQVRAMQELTATERTAFVLRHMEARTTAEIAATLQIAPNAAKQAVFRAVRKLRRSLAPLKVNA
jgi:RNA polymerase sigma-70 factor, ECF subfamily